MNELPTMTASAYKYNTLAGGGGGGGGGGGAHGLGGLRAINQLVATGTTLTDTTSDCRINPFNHISNNLAYFSPKQEVVDMSKSNGSSKLRVVRVFLVDPDERVPVEKRVLHKTEEITTDATDQELFFDIPVSELLKAHNKYRETIEWEDSEGEAKTGLKEVRVRDLTMSVTTLAQF